MDFQPRQSMAFTDPIFQVFRNMFPFLWYMAPVDGCNIGWKPKKFDDKHF